MRKLGTIILVLAVASTCFAAINKLTTETQAIQILSSLKSKLESDSVRYVAIRQKIEDKLANALANLDAVDQTKLGALPAEIQDIVNAIDDLITKIETHYPEVE